MTNPYLEVLERDEQEEAARRQAATSQAIGVNPDQAARAKQVAGYLGVPSAVVESAPEEAQRRAQLQKIDEDTAASPLLRRRFSNPEWAKLAHDDTGALAAVEGAARKFGGAAADVGKYIVSAPGALEGGLVADLSRGVRAIASGAPKAGAGLYGLAAAPFELLGLDTIGGFLRDQQRQSDQVANYWSPLSADAGLVQRGVVSGLQSAGQTLITLPLGLAQRGEQMMLGAMGAFTAGQSYGAARDKGLSPARAIPHAAADAVAEVITERYLGAAGFLQQIKAGASAGKLFMYELLREVPGEMAATLWQNFNEWANLNPEKTLSQFVDEQPAALAETAIATLVGGTTQIGVVKSVERTLLGAAREQVKAAEAESFTEHLSDVLKALEGSKLRQRDLSSLADFVQEAAQEAGHDGNVYVDAAALADVLNQSGVTPEQLAAMSPTVAAALSDAVTLNGTVAIPVGELVGKFTDMQEALLPHLRPTEDGLSQEEAKVVTQQAQQYLEQAAARVIQQAADTALQQLASTKVAASIVEQLNSANRFTKDVNEAYGALVAAFYTAAGQRHGLSAEEMFARYPLRVQAVQPEGASIEQDAAGMRTVQVQGARRPIEDANGRLVGRTFGEQQNFWKWFGDSKVVDASGKPQPVYHGTGADFEAFGREHAGKATGAANAKLGFFFTNRPDIADRYAGQADGANVMPAYLSLRNPLRLQAANMLEADRALMAQLTAEHDGAVIQVGEGDRAQTVYMVRGETQAKSAIGNRGTFDPNDANILHQPAFHGSPHDFDRFSTDKIGTGEGNQTFGWGLYFAENKEVANTYKEALSQTHVYLDGQRVEKLDSSTPAGAALSIVSGFGIEYALQRVEVLRQEVEANGGDMAWVDQWQAEIEKLRGHEVERRDSGSIYTVDIPDEAVALMLDLDKPFEKQAPGVKKALKDSGIWKRYKDNLSDFASPMGTRGKGRGENIYQFLAWEQKSPRAASLLLDSIGIPGLKYLDEESRAKGRGTRNLVVFNDKNVQLTHKDGSPVTKTERDEFFQGKSEKTPPRGTFSPASLTITLLEKADLSTFLHETGHFFLEAMSDMAAQPNAPADLGRDMLTVLEWFGVRTLDEWNAMTLEQQRPYHEKFAESFEQYLFEGKAPSRELGSLFGRFRAWLTNVYRSLQQFMASYNTQLTDEVRHVFDRLIATQEQIEQAEEDAGFASMLEQFKGKVDPALLEHYQRLTGEATEEAMARLHARSLRDLKWIVNARGRELKRLSKDVAEKRKAVEAEVTAEVDAAPEMQAAAAMEEMAAATPELKDARKDWRDRREAAEERAREEVKAKYNAQAAEQGLKGLQKGQYLAKNKKAIDHEVAGALIQWERENQRPARPPVDMNLDAIAERFGFSSGDHMLQAIDAYGPRDVAIEGITNQRMLERFGDLVTPEGLQRAANEAVHNEARARAVAAEMQALQASVTAKAPTGKTITAKTKTGKIQYQQTTNAIVEAARRFAVNLVARRKVRDLKAGQHQVAERKAGKLAMEAAAKGKSEEAMAAKRDQLLNFYASKETLAAIDEIEKGVKYLRKVADSETLDADYRDQIAVMLERFDLRPASNKALDRRATLLEWVEEQRTMGIEPEIPPALLNEAVRQNYRDMTVEEFRGLVDTVKQMEHLGRLKHKLLTAKDEREFADVVQRIVDRIIESGGDRTIENVTPNTELGKKLHGLQKFAAQHVKAATWARVMDGGKDGGPLWEYIIRAANEAGNKEVEMRAQATRDLSELVAPLMEGGKMDAKLRIDAINTSLNRQARLAVALNMGNASNLQRLMGGHGWTAEQVAAIGQTLTEQEWRFVQKVWDYFGGYRAEIGAKEKRVSGVEPKWIEPTPLELHTADGKDIKLRGGYYPVKFDPEASHRAEAHADAEGAKQQMRAAYTAATTRRSFTKTRADEVTGRPLMLSLDGIYQGVNEVIHDLSWHEFLIDANRLVGNDKVAAAMRQKFGAGAHQQFKSWLQDVAKGETSVVGEGFAGWLRSGVSIAGLGFNIMSAAIQPLGITQSITRVGAKWVGRGIARYTGAPLETTKLVHEKSTFMAHRAQTRLRELAEVQARIQGRSKLREGVDIGAYYLMLKAQQAVDVPTWVGAYEKATVEGGFDEDTAVQLADQAVIDAQGSGTLKDQAAVERGGQMKKLLTVFYSFFNTTLNNLVLQTYTEKSRPKLAADYLLLVVVPVVLGAMLRDALTAGDSGDWEDPRKIAKRLIGEEISFLMGLMFGVREFTAAAQAVTGTAKYSTDYSGPAGVRMVGDVTKLGVQANQGELDPAFRKALVNVAGEVLRLPSAQINRSITGYEALRDGKTSNPLALLTGYQEPSR